MTVLKHPWRRFGLDLVTLRVFAATTEEGSLARAAERESIALSAISRRISALEARSGVQLFDRHDRGMTLTPAGEMLLHRLHGVFDLLDHIALDLEALHKGTKGVVRIHAHSSAITEGFSAELQTFISEHPGLDVQIEEHTSREVVHAVSTSTAELGLISGTAETGNLHVIPWREDTLVVALPAGDYLTTQRQLKFAALLERPFISMQKDSALSTLCRGQARMLGKTLIERAHATSFESVRKMVAAGLGVAIMPVSVIDPQEAIVSRPLEESWARRPLSLCVRTLEHMPAATKLLVQWLTRRHEVSKPKPQIAAIFPPPTAPRLMCQTA